MVLHRDEHLLFIVVAALTTLAQVAKTRLESTKLNLEIPIVGHFVFQLL